MGFWCPLNITHFNPRTFNFFWMEFEKLIVIFCVLWYFSVVTFWFLPPSRSRNPFCFEDLSPGGLKVYVPGLIVTIVSLPLLYFFPFSIGPIGISYLSLSHCTNNLNLLLMHKQRVFVEHKGPIGKFKIFLLFLLYGLIVEVVAEPVQTPLLLVY